MESSFVGSNLIMLIQPFLFILLQVQAKIAVLMLATLFSRWWNLMTSCLLPIMLTSSWNK
eukprot:scaffold4097_cov317-Alexandrium_tamarense.AAC.1